MSKKQKKGAIMLQNWLTTYYSVYLWLLWAMWILLSLVNIFQSIENTTMPFTPAIVYAIQMQNR